jgi:hypothetical protein
VITLYEIYIGEYFQNFSSQTGILYPRYGPN